MGSPSCPQSCTAGCGISTFNELYYTTFTFSQPIQDANVNCGDNSTLYQTRFSINDFCNIQYVENPSSNFWSITIPQSPLVNCYPNNCGCDSCYNAINNFVILYNGSANDPNIFTFTTNVGAKYSDPFSKSGISRLVPPVLSGSHCELSNMQNDLINLYSTHTIPFIPSTQSPTGWTNLPSLGASLPCNFSYYPNSSFYFSEGKFLNGVVSSYQIRFPHLGGTGFNYSLSTNDFEIYSISNLTNTGSSDTPNQWPYPCPTGNLIYSYIGGVVTVHSASYFVGGYPTLYVYP